MFPFWIRETFYAERWVSHSAPIHPHPMRADSYGSILRDPASIYWKLKPEAGWGSTERNSIIHLQCVRAMHSSKYTLEHTVHSEEKGKKGGWISHGERQQCYAWLALQLLRPSLAVWSKFKRLLDWWPVHKWDLPLRMCFCTQTICVFRQLCSRVWAACVYLS